MKWKEISKYLGLFIFAVAVIAVYKTFDNIGVVFGWLGHLVTIVRPFIIGFVIAYILMLPCRFIERKLENQKNEWLKKHRRPIAVVIIYAAFVLIITLVLFAIIPSIVSSLVDFYNNLPGLIEDFVNWFNSLNLGVTIGKNSLSQLFDNEYFSIQNLLKFFDRANMNRYARSVKSIGSGVAHVFMGVIVSVYMLLDRANLKNSLIRLSRVLFKEKTRSFIAKYLRRINDFVNKYIYCMVIDAIIIFVLAAIVLSIERVEYAPLLGLMLGVFNLIPYFGAIIATATIGIITVFTGSLTLAIVAVISMIVLQQVDANFIQPRLLAGSLKVKPLWVIFAVLVGGGLCGAVGIFMAVPIAALCRSIILDFMENREAKAGIPSPPREQPEEPKKPKRHILPKRKKGKDSEGASQNQTGTEAKPEPESNIETKPKPETETEKENKNQKESE